MATIDVFAALDAIEKKVLDQQKSRAKEIVVSRKEWDLFSLRIQETINYVQYDLADPPILHGKGSVVVATKRKR